MILSLVSWLLILLCCYCYRCHFYLVQLFFFDLVLSETVKHLQVSYESCTHYNHQQTLAMCAVSPGMSQRANP